MFLLNNKVQTGGYKTFLHFPERSLSYAKIVQTLFPTKQNPLFLALPHPCLIALTTHPSFPG